MATKALILLWGLFSQGLLSDVLIDRNCDDDILIHDANMLTVGNWTALRVLGTCCVNITATHGSPVITSGFRLMFGIEDLQVAGMEERRLTDDERAQALGNRPTCTKFRLDIVDADSGRKITPDGGLCENHLPSTHYVSTARSATMTLTFNMTSDVSQDDAKLRILAVRFHNNPCDCDTEFECDNNRCVASTLKCNGQDDCGDNSDETDGCLLSHTAIIIIAVTSSVFVIAVIVAGVIMFKRSDRMRTGWGEARLIAGASSLNDEWPDSRHTNRSKSKRKPKQLYGATQSCDVE